MGKNLTIAFMAILCTYCGSPRSNFYNIQGNALDSLKELCPENRDDLCEIRVPLFLADRWGWKLDYRVSWQASDLKTLYNAGVKIEQAFERNGGDGKQRLRDSIGDISLSHVSKSPVAKLFGELKRTNHVLDSTVYFVNNFTLSTAVHEMGHILDNRGAKPGINLKIWGAAIWGGGRADAMAKTIHADPRLCTLRFSCIRTASQTWDKILKSLKSEAPPTIYAGNGPSEDFADSFEQFVSFKLYSKAKERNSYFKSLFNSL